MAFSLHRHLLNKTGKETVTSFKKAWDLSDARMAGRHVPLLASDPRYLAYKFSCQIGSHTKRLLEAVPREQVTIVILDDLIKEPRATLSKILSFLDLPTSAPLNIDHENDGVTLKYPQLKRGIILGQKAIAKIGIRTPPPELLKQIVRSVVKPGEKSAISEDDRIMTTKYFLDEIHLIWQLTGNRRDEWVECLNNTSDDYVETFPKN